MGVRGDFDRLDEIIAAADRLAEKRTIRELVGELGREALELVDEGFEQGRAPSGRRWEPPRFRSGPPLQLTGRLRRSFVLRVTADGFEIVTSVPYAGPLQAGIRSRGRLVARRMLPDTGEITRRWERALRAHAVGWMDSVVGQ